MAAPTSPCVRRYLATRLREIILISEWLRCARRRWTSSDHRRLAAAGDTRFEMDATTPNASLIPRLPSRHVTGLAPRRWRAAARGPETRSIRSMVFEIFKKTPHVPDSKPTGRDVAKDMSKTGGLVLRMNTSSDHGNQRGECFTRTGPVVPRNLNVKQIIDHVAHRWADAPITGGTGDVYLIDEKRTARRTKGQPRATYPMSRVFWKYARQVGTASHGAGIHAGGAHEKLCYADI